MPELIYTIQGFDRGIDQSKDRQLYPVDVGGSSATQNGGYYIENCKVSDGVLERVEGSTRHTTGKLDKPIDTLIRYYAGSVGKLICASGGSLYKLDGNIYTQIKSGYTSNNWDFINYQTDNIEIVIMCNGKQAPQVYDGKTIRDLKHDGKKSSASSTNQAPKGKYIELYKERVWISGVAGQPNTLYFSTAFDADDWTAPITEEEVNQHGGMIEIPSWDGGKIVALKALFRELLVFKEKNVFRIAGTYPGNFSSEEIFNNVNGVVYNDTIQSINNSAFWLTSDGLFIYDGVNVTDISVKIKEFFSTINRNYMDKSFSVIHKDKYYLFVPVGTSTVPNKAIVLDIKTGTITIQSGVSATSLLSFQDHLLYATSSGEVFRLNEGSTFNAQPIKSYFDSGDLTFGVLNARKSLESLYFVGKGDGKIRITVTTENGSRSTDISLTPEIKNYAKIKLKNKGRRWKITIENVDGSYFLIKSPQFLFDVDFD